ncbi:nuclear transport factor 2 family protein [Euzebya tangerina]|uniref:nuclear transport factor 2 family protein n=1 Tax=Euzebya tangerina TaxID=591198 RepID=UPI0013C3239C|nr:nuclear transport factor 2 family protein [Euzebya tangerina]
MVQELLDQRAIEQVFVRYFDRVDAKDHEGAAALFAEDCEFDIMTGQVVLGRERYARLLRAVLAQYGATSHAVSNFLIRVDGDVAHSVAYVHAVHRMVEDGRIWQLWARIEDDLERRDEGWVVTRHTLHGVDSEPAWDAIPNKWYGGHPAIS